jgi:hypothetical protein
MELTSYEKQVHESALRVSSVHDRSEINLVQILQEVEKIKLFKKFDGCGSSFEYATKILKKTPPIAYMLIAVTRKGKEVPALQQAIQEKRITVPMAHRLVSQIRHENAEELISFAESHSYRETEIKLAELSPREAVKEKAQFIAGGLVKVTSIMTIAEFQELERLQSLQAKRNKIQNKSQAIVAAIEIAVEKLDPVKRSERAEKRKRRKQKTPAANQTRAGTGQEANVSLEEEGSQHSPSETQYGSSRPLSQDWDSRVSEHNKQLVLWAHRVDLSEIETTYGRKNMTANQINAVQRRDQGRCIFECADGHRCGSDRWVQIHHIVEVSRGGSNHPSNLVTLCPLHHDLVHQMSFQLGEKSNFLREPQRPYGFFLITKSTKDSGPHSKPFGPFE